MSRPAMSERLWRESKVEAAGIEPASAPGLYCAACVPVPRTPALTLSSLVRPETISIWMPSERPVLISRRSNFCGAVSTSTNVSSPLELEQALLDREHLVAAVEHDVGVGAVVGADEDVGLLACSGRADLELDRAVLLDALGGDVLEDGVELRGLEGADREHERPCRACSFPTSDSSTFPSKIMSPMSATVAIVVPSLKVLASMTELPSLTGTSSTVPAIVERTSVFDAFARAGGDALLDDLEVVLRGGELLLRGVAARASDWRKSRVGDDAVRVQPLAGASYSRSASSARDRAPGRRGSRAAASAAMFGTTRIRASRSPVARSCPARRRSPRRSRRPAA